jgi:hypothetical protein
LQAGPQRAPRQIGETPTLSAVYDVGVAQRVPPAVDSPATTAIDNNHIR